VSKPAEVHTIQGISKVGLPVLSKSYIIIEYSCACYVISNVDSGPPVSRDDIFTRYGTVVALLDVYPVFVVGESAVSTRIRANQIELNKYAPSTRITVSDANAISGIAADHISGCTPPELIATNDDTSPRRIYRDTSRLVDQIERSRAGML
jgi:hypothetical protein